MTQAITVPTQFLPDTATGAIWRRGGRKSEAFELRDEEALTLFRIPGQDLDGLSTSRYPIHPLSLIFSRMKYGRIPDPIRRTCFGFCGGSQESTSVGLKVLVGQTFRDRF